MNSAHALTQLAGFGLAHLTDAPIALDAPDEFLALADGRRALPWIAAADAAGMIDGVSDEWRTRLSDRHLAAVQTTMAAHAAAVAAMTQLARAGVAEVIVLKGVATGHLDYARPVDRFSSDVDLLVRGVDLDAVLAAFPGTVPPTPRRPGWDARYGKAVTVVSDSGVELDIHTSVAQGYFGLAIGSDELFRSAVELHLGSVVARALDAPNRLLHTTIHLATSQYTGLHSARDVPQLVLVGGVDWRAAVERAQRWGIDAIVARGVLSAWSSFGLGRHPIVDWARSVEPSGRQRLAMKLSAGPHARHYLTGPLALPVRRWPGYLYPIVWPSKEYLSEHGKTRTQRIRLLLPNLRADRPR